MLSAIDLDRMYESYASALWKGDSTLPDLDEWLNAHWHEIGPPPPTAEPVAVSLHGAGGRGILWYEGPTDILGFVPSGCGYFRVPRTERVPEQADAPAASHRMLVIL